MDYPVATIAGGRVRASCYFGMSGAEVSYHIDLVARFDGTLEQDGAVYHRCR